MYTQSALQSYQGISPQRCHLFACEWEVLFCTLGVKKEKNIVYSLCVYRNGFKEVQVVGCGNITRDDENNLWLSA